MKAALLLSSLVLAGANAAASDVLVPAGSVWKYLDDGSDQGGAWAQPGFDDGAWAAGPAQLGYGDGDEATVVSYGGNANNKYITTYFRQTFTVADPAAYQGVEIQLLRDDGAVVYLNGVEVARSNMPSGAVNSLTRASSAVGGAEESTFFVFTAPAGALVSGENTLAVEIHQSGPTSSDISFDLALLGDDGTPSLTRGPYLQLVTPDGVTFRWRTNRASDTLVRYGDAPDNLTQTMTIAESVTEHEIRVDGLDPATRFYYQIESGSVPLAGGDADHFFTTNPVPGARSAVRAWVIGDSGTADNNARAVRDAYLTASVDHPADLWLMLGDNAYDDGLDSEYQAAVFDMYPMLLRSTPLWTTLGNHDGHTADSATESGPYYDNFTLPRAGEAGGLASGTEAYYAFDWANIHFVCLESYETDRSVGSPMLNWLQADLDATTQDWIIAFWHHPPYTKGSHNSDTEIELVEMRENVLPMLEAAGVDLVLCGHSHSYERSYLLDGHYGTSDTLDPDTMILDHGDGREGGDGPYTKPLLPDRAHRGAVYAVAGSSGKTSGGALDHPAMFVAFNELGSIVLDVEADRLHAEFLTRTGQVHDSFTMLHTACAADINGDGVIDTRDVVAFLNLWAAGDARADFNGDGTVDSRDLIAFLNAWAGGC